jgi:hypothetical protein
MEIAVKQRTGESSSINSTAAEKVLDLKNHRDVKQLNGS